MAVQKEKAVTITSTQFVSVIVDSINCWIDSDTGTIAEILDLCGEDRFADAMKSFVTELILKLFDDEEMEVYLQ